VVRAARSVASRQRFTCLLPFALLPRWELDRRPWPSFHFGMTGSFVVRGVAAPVYKSFAVDGAAWPPRFAKLTLRLSDGGELSFADSRRFARVRLQEDPPAEAPLSDLGWDALLEPPSAEAFAASLGRRSAPIKAVLLDQSFCAGVGNWVADECLFQARIHPEVPARELGPHRSAALLAALRSVCATAVGVDADSARFPADWLFHRRWGKKAGSTACGHALAFLTVGGRTSCFAPALQRKTEAGGAEPSSAAAAAAPEGKKKTKAEPKKRAAAAAASEGGEADAAAAAPKRGRRPGAAAAAVAAPRVAGRGRAAAAAGAVQLAAAAARAGRLRLP